MIQAFCKKKYLAVTLIFFLSAFFYLYSEQLFKIESVSFDIQGTTKEYPLSRVVYIDTVRIFNSIENLDSYILDLKKQYQNQRVFESADITTRFGEENTAGVTPVYLTVHTVDTLNIIALPYPKYDSNSGFELKLKFKDYNFMGSMQVLNGDLNFGIDNEGKSNINSNLDFSIPFKAWDYSWSWNTDASVEFPQDEIPEYNFKTGLSVLVPLGISSFNFGLTQGVIVNDRNDTELYKENPIYFNETFSVSYPITLVKLDFFGPVNWTPSSTISTNWSYKKIQHTDLKGPAFSWGHSISTGRYDWIGNFRKGLGISIANNWSYNITHGGKIGGSIDGTVTAYTTFLNIFGLNSRIFGFYNFNSSLSSSAGSKMRGILNSRISSDTAITGNFDIPIKVMNVDFFEITGISWTKYISFELHAIPFIDITLSHDKNTNRYFSLKDAWYSSGLDIVVFPFKMRSIYGRIGIGYDLLEVYQSGGKLEGRSRRDDAQIRELFFGIGLHY